MESASDYLWAVGIGVSAFIAGIGLGAIFLELLLNRLAQLIVKINRQLDLNRMVTRTQQERVNDLREDGWEDDDIGVAKGQVTRLRRRKPNGEWEIINVTPEGLVNGRKG